MHLDTRTTELGLVPVGHQGGLQPTGVPAAPRRS